MKFLGFAFLSLFFLNFGQAEELKDYSPNKFYSCHLKALIYSQLDNVHESIMRQDHLYSMAHCSGIYSVQLLCRDNSFCLTQILGMAMMTGCLRPNFFDDYSEYGSFYQECIK